MDIRSILPLAAIIITFIFIILPKQVKMKIFMWAVVVIAAVTLIVLVGGHLYGIARAEDFETLSVGVLYTEPSHYEKNELVVYFEHNGEILSWFEGPDKDEDPNTWSFDTQTSYRVIISPSGEVLDAEPEVKTLISTGNKTVDVVLTVIEIAVFVVTIGGSGYAFYHLQ